MKLQFFFKIFFILSFSLFAYANESIDLKLEKLTLELRCMTCQNKIIHDSDSDYSKDIKIFVKKKFEEGLNEKEIKKILTKRYGEYILFKPYFNLKNLFLWLFPFILVILSMIILINRSKKTKSE